MRQQPGQGAAGQPQDAADRPGDILQPAQIFLGAQPGQQCRAAAADHQQHGQPQDGIPERPCSPALHRGKQQLRPAGELLPFLDDLAKPARVRRLRPEAE